MPLTPRRRPLFPTLLVLAAIPANTLAAEPLSADIFSAKSVQIDAAPLSIEPFAAQGEVQSAPAPKSTETTGAPPGGLSWIIGGGLAVGVALAAAGGGGGGGGGGDTPNPEPEGPAPEGGKNPSEFETLEYRRDYTLSMINAAARYADGGTGWGTLLSAFDTGADVGHADLAPNIAFTKSYFGTGDSVIDYDDHGTHVASIMAAAKNDLGMHGVAFDAKLAIFQGIGWEGAPAMTIGLRDALADAQRSSVGMGASAINHSWVFVDEQDNERLVSDFTRSSLRSFLGSSLISAFEQSRDGDLITVFATGNAGKDQPSVMAGIPYLMPELGSHWLGVTAVDATGRLADYANACGLAKDYCLAAPGSAVYGALSSDAGHAQDSFGFMSGTSMAAPHVGGAIGVMKSNFPELTGAEISLILRETARDLGAPGIDEVYGYGLLDLANAVAPQGDITIMTGRSIDEGAIALGKSWITGDTALTSSLTRSLSGKTMMVADRYDRGFETDMATMVGTSRGLSGAMRSGLAAFTRQRGPETGAISLSRAGIDAGLARSWASPTALGSAYAPLAGGDLLAFSGATPLGELTLKSTFGEDGASYAAAELERDLAGGHSISLEIGQLSEQGALLGMAVTGAFGGDLHARTGFARLGGDVALGGDFSLTASGSIGTTAFSSSGILARGENIRSSALGLGVKRNNLLRPGDSLTIGLSRPLGISGGRMTIDTPSSFAASSGLSRSRGVYRDRSEIALAGSEATTDIQVGYARALRGGRISLGGVWRPEGSGRGPFSLAAGYSLAF